MRLRILAVGKDRKDPLLEAAAEYIERIRRYYAIELVEVREEPAKEKTPADRVRRLEAERLKVALAPGELVVALDQRGKEQTSEDVAKRIASWAGQGKSSVAFLIGGPLGLDPALLSEILRQQRSSRVMDVIKKALENRTVLSNVSVSGIGYLRAEDRDAIPQGADFLLTEENVHTAIVFGIIIDGSREVLSGSMRTLKLTVDPDEFWSLLQPPAFLASASELPFANCAWGAPYR